MTTETRARVCLALAAVLIAGSGGAGCRQDMHDQPSYQPLEASGFFPDGRSARQPVAGTVARGQLDEDTLRHTGKVEGAFAREFPSPVDARMLARGRQRFDIFCAPCHDRLGEGRGMIVLRGFPAPPSFHIDRLRNVEEGYLFDVMTNGFGRMQGYAAQVPVEDRWAIVAYIRALQLSQAAPESLLTAEEKARVRAGGRP